MYLGTPVCHENWHFAGCSLSQYNTSVEFENRKISVLSKLKSRNTFTVSLANRIAAHNSSFCVVYIGLIGVTFVFAYSKCVVTLPLSVTLR